MAIDDRDFAEVSPGKVGPIDRFIGFQLRKHRQKRNMTLHDVSDALGISYQQVQKYEQAISRVSASTLYKLTKLYEIDIGNFFEEVDSEASLYRKRQNKLAGAFRKNAGISVLIVEPDPEDEQIVRNILNEIPNLNILCVHDGIQALNVLKYKTLCSDFPKPNLVFLDIYIPKRDGISVLKELKREESTRDIPIVIITNNISAELQAKAYKFGAQGYIIKSPEMDSFKNKILYCVKYWTEIVVAPN